jgi:hypothetical protein
MFYSFLITAHEDPNCIISIRTVIYCVHHRRPVTYNDYSGVTKPQSIAIYRGGIRSTQSLGPTMTTRGQSIGISIGMLLQTLIMSRLDQLSRLGARI